MKRALTTADFALALLLCLGAALAAGGDAGDPLISLSYLTEQFSKTFDAAVDARLDAAGDALRESIRQSAASSAAGRREVLLNTGDVLSGEAGLTLVPLAGDLRLCLEAGALVDATAGAEAPDGSLLSPWRRYIAAEDTRLTLTAEGPTAVLSVQGDASLLRSASPRTTTPSPPPCGSWGSSGAPAPGWPEASTCTWPPPGRRGL